MSPAQFSPVRERSFAYFSAFDETWRAFDEIAAPVRARSTEAHRAEAHWGMFDEHRQPKPVVTRIPLLESVSR
jgi:hypothetical protein